MSKRLNLALLFLPLALAACTSTTSLPPGERIGEEVAPGRVLRFAVVDASPASFFERTLLVEATVVAVCQTKGCWMQVEDEGRTAMVRWETGCGGKYSFPKDGAGRRVLIQGSFYPKTISPEDALHIQEEADRALEIPLEGYEFNASAVIVLG